MKPYCPFPLFLLLLSGHSFIPSSPRPTFIDWHLDYVIAFTVPEPIFTLALCFFINIGR